MLIPCAEKCFYADWIHETIYIYILLFLGSEAVNDLRKEAEIEILERFEISVPCKKIFLGKAAMDTVQ